MQNLIGTHLVMSRVNSRIYHMCGRERNIANGFIMWIIGYLYWVECSTNFALYSLFEWYISNTFSTFCGTKSCVKYCTRLSGKFWASHTCSERQKNCTLSLNVLSRLSNHTMATVWQSFYTSCNKGTFLFAKKQLNWSYYIAISVTIRALVVPTAKANPPKISAIRPCLFFLCQVTFSGKLSSNS